MDQATFLDAILDAAIFAAEKHQGQVRKDEGASPYVTHPLTVAREVFTTGKVSDLTVLIAAILHDTLEDTPTIDEEISTHFGDEVLSIVREVTDDKSLNKALRKRLQVIHAPELSHPARIIKLADKLVNCRDILFTPPKNWNIDRRRDYIQWGADVIAQIRGTNPGLEDAFDRMLSEAETRFDFHIEPFSTVHNRPWGPDEDRPTA